MTGGGTVFTWLATIWAGLAVPTLVGCLTRWDPLERAGGRAVGPRISSRWGWFLMEIPALATFPGIYLASSHHHPRQPRGHHVDRPHAIDDVEEDAGAADYQRHGAVAPLHLGS